MSNIEFYKYQGTGNDFIMIDDRDNQFDENNTTLVEQMCSRRFGIGADGLILLRNHKLLEFEMIYFNADGNQSTMCGNGGRCLVKFAHDIGVFENSTSFMAVDGTHSAKVEGDMVHLQMIDVFEVQTLGGDFFMDTGSPHFVRFVDSVETLNVAINGKELRYDERFSENGGTNVNFVEKVSAEEIFVRTYERGVEAETYSCGTGVTACSIAAGIHAIQPPVKVRTLGGELSVDYKKTGKKYTDIYLIGPAKRVFKGQYPTT